ncbi:MAG: peptidoglycan DD-metalloendopeptidase family protein [Muribaculaceae bacterium]|nr:peptidoglycan DD-metalloendopeptidase family protein [Muribaculaceae bacterium]
MILKKLTVALTLGIATLVAFPSNAQNLQSVTHGNVHDDLLASQQHIQDQIRLNETKEYMDILLKEEEEPELDIYKEGWESDRVNSYKNALVPNSKTIDVSEFSMPCRGYVTSPYGYRPRFRRMHKGIDLKVQVGDTIRAAFDGKIRLTKYDRRGYGYYVIVRHENGLETVYGHLSRFLVRPDQYVKVGDAIALGGNTGRSTGSHLHFETRFMGYAINPSAIFDFANQTTHTDKFTFDKRTYENGRDYSPNSYRYASSKGSNKYKSTGSKSTYKVRKGDSLSRIASRHGVTVAKLCKVNNISRSTKLKPGKVLKIN